MTDAEKIAEYKARYEKALHGMQAGVGMVMEMGLTKGHEPKHLRVGVNSAMVEHSALTLLLIEKKIITELEYYRSMCRLMEAEHKSYENQLTQATGMRVTLI